MDAGNYVIVEPIPEGDKVKGEIVAVLMADHIKHIKKIGKWFVALYLNN